MLRVGLTGGIGSGKSTVAQLLVARGAVLIEADRVAREIMEPGQAVFDAVVARFGSSVLGVDGRLDRPALAAIVFADPEARADLDAITHPVIGAVMAERARAWEATERIVILDVPLLRPATVGFYGLEVVVVVDVPEAVAVARLVAARGFDRSDAEARVAAQMRRSDRLAFADIVIDNRATPDDLTAEVDRVWSELVGRAHLA